MLSLDLDRKNDILYIKMNDTSSSYGDEMQNGIVVLKDFKDDKITGATIFDFQKKRNSNKINDLRLPVNIDFDKDVYPQLEMC